MRKGQPQSAEARKKISESMKGRPKSFETREKMAFAAVQRWNKKRNRDRLLRELTAPLNQQEVAVAPSNAISEAFAKEGHPVA